MGHRVHALVAFVLCASLPALACSLPQSLLQSIGSSASDSLGDTAEETGPAEGGAEVEPEMAIEGLTEGEVSPPYDIYVGATVTGNCGPYTNSGGFAALTFDSAFHGMRFSPPSDDSPWGPYGGISQGGGVAIPVVGVGLLGEGQLGAFTFCPMYEPEAHACSVTAGPLPFEPSLRLVPSESGVPVAPIAGTPVPAGGGEAVLVYSIGAARDLSPILTWDCEIGTGALGSSLNPVQVTFSVSWESLMLGEEFSLGAISGDEGETWEWTIRFVPAE